MKQSLYEGTTDKERELVRIDYEKALPFRKNLIRVLEKEVQTIVTSMCDEDLFSKDWPLVQATKIAEIKSKRRLIALLE